MNRITTATLAVLIAGGSAFALFAGGPGSFPDPELTPGIVATTDVHEVCGIVGGLTYSKRHRATTYEMKAEVRQRYAIAGHFRGEIDHRVPLCLGGADDIRNLWPQVDFKAKDELEARTCHLVCTGKLPLADGQAIFLGDWRVKLPR